MEPVVGGTKGRDSRMERGHRRDVPGLDGETKVHASARESKRKGERKREDIFARRVAGERNEWRLQTTRERRMVRNPWRKRGRDKGEENSPREED